MVAKSYMNSAGIYLSLSGATARHGRKSRFDPFGSALNDALRTGGASTLAGGDGDDTYLRVFAKDIVVEKPNEGIDTIISSATTYTLPENVENHTVLGKTGIGNSRDNIIISSGTGLRPLTAAQAMTSSSLAPARTRSCSPR